MNTTHNSEFVRNIWQIRKARPGDFDESLLGATSPFVFSTVN